MAKHVNSDMRLKTRLMVFVWLFIISFACIFSRELSRRMLRGYELEMNERIDELLKRRSA